MTGITCVNCYVADATQALRSGVYCAECYTYMIKGVTK